MGYDNVDLILTVYALVALCFRYPLTLSCKTGKSRYFAIKRGIILILLELSTCRFFKNWRYLGDC